MEVTFIGQALTLVGTAGGIWGVFLLFRWFQHDFVAVSRRELDEERKRADAADRAADRERVLRIHAQTYSALCERKLIEAGITPPPPLPAMFQTTEGE